jgi:LPXTG-motif cell wall-anchored protein
VAPTTSASGPGADGDRWGIGGADVEEPTARDRGAADTTQVLHARLGVGGGDLADDLAVRGLILGGAPGEAFGVGGAKTSGGADDRVLGAAAAGPRTSGLPVTGAGLAWLALAGALLVGVGTRLVARRRPALDR